MMRKKCLDETYEKFIIVSDTHIGSRQSDKKTFGEFRDYQKAEKDKKCIVLNGDIVDLWERDDLGLVIENARMFCELEDLNVVDYNVGNHDYHLRRLQNNNYQFEFSTDLTLSFGGKNYRILHGHQLDPTQLEPLFDPLCKKTGDGLGGSLDYTWGTLIGPRKLLEAILGCVYSLKYRKDAKKMLMSPKEREIEDITKKNAISFANKHLGENEYLLFSHTHRGFDNEDKVANSGALGLRGIPNTYLEIDHKGNVKLEKF